MRRRGGQTRAGQTARDACPGAQGPGSRSGRGNMSAPRTSTASFHGGQEASRSKASPSQCKGKEGLFRFRRSQLVVGNRSKRLLILIEMFRSCICKLPVYANRAPKPDCASTSLRRHPGPAQHTRPILARGVCACAMPEGRSPRARLGCLVTAARQLGRAVGPHFQRSLRRSGKIPSPPPAPRESGPLARLQTRDPPPPSSPHSKPRETRTAWPGPI